MANALYPKTKAQLLQGTINLLTANVKAMLVDLADYTYDAAHDFLNDVPAPRASRSRRRSPARPSTISRSSIPLIRSSSAWRATSSKRSSCSSTPPTKSTSRLIMFQDTGVTGLPLTPDGNNVQIVISANGWFTL